MANRLMAYEIGKISPKVKGEALKQALVKAAMTTECDDKSTQKTYKKK